MVEEFIHRRFKLNCDWLTGNCYYFAVILKARFPEGFIAYDVINGHFIFNFHGDYYDWHGKIETEDTDNFIPWDEFYAYDSEQEKRIFEGCIA